LFKFIGQNKLNKLDDFPADGLHDHLPVYFNGLIFFRIQDLIGDGLIEIYY